MPVRTAITWLFGIALATTLVLKDRQTAPILREGLGGFRGVLATAMGTGKQV